MSNPLWDDSHLNKTFKNVQLENAWREEFSKDHRNYDIASLLLGFVILAASYQKVDPAYTGWIKFRALLFLYSMVILQIVLFIIVVYRQEYFHRNRGTIIALQALSRIIVYYTVVASCSELFHSLVPLPLDKNYLLMARQLVFVPLILARVNTSHLAPLHSAKYIFYFGVPIVLHHGIIRCTEEVAGVPGQGVIYQNIAVAAENFSNKWLSFPPFSILNSLEAVRVANLSEVGACIVVRNSLVVIVAYFLPMVLFYTEEINSRKKFERERGLGTAFAHQPSTQFLLHVLLLPFQAAVTLHAFVYITWLASEWL